MSERLTDDELLQLFEAVRMSPRRPWESEKALPEALRSVYEAGLLGSAKSVARHGELARRRGRAMDEHQIVLAQRRAINAETARPYVHRFAELRRLNVARLLDANNRRGSISRERHFGFWVIRHIPVSSASRGPRFSFPEIGDAFKVDHSSVVKALKRLDAELKRNGDLKAELLALVERMDAAA